MEVEDIYRAPQADMALAPVALEAPRELAPFFQTSLLKVVVLSTATFGLYQLTWFYRQWDRRKDHGEDVSPLARTIFTVLFAYWLFKSVNEEIELRADLADARRGPEEPPADPGDRIAPLPAGLLALLYVVFNVFSRVRSIPLMAPLSVFVTCGVLMINQKKINQLHAKLGYDPNEGKAFTAGSIAAVALGALVWIFILLAMLGAVR